MRIVIALRNFTLLTLLFFLLYLLLVPASPYVVISAVSEVIAYRVSRTEVAAIPLVNAQVRSSDASVLAKRSNNAASFVTGLLQPASNSIVHYRYLSGKVAIIVEGGKKSAGEIRFPDGSTRNLSKRAKFVLDTSNGAMPRLPIAGPAEIGLEYGVQSTPAGNGTFSQPIMSEGSIIVFSRGRIYPYEKELYPVSGATFPLPSGGRLSSGDSLIPNSESDAKPWFGIAQIIPSGFKISATTISPNLHLYRMGSRESETFAFSILTQAASDPIFQLIILFIGGLQTLATVWVSKKSSKKPTPNHDKYNFVHFSKYFRNLIFFR